ncbi:MAG: hypothetical protein LC745_11520 [Planctomycetia bacterium]|nr:hypothetical protein [Planctomycetia bacterium]
MSRRTLSAVVVLIALGAAGLGWPAPGQPPAPETGSAALLATARDAFKTIDQMRAAGQHIDSLRHYVWSRRLMEAERDSARTKAERVAAAKGHVDRMAKLMKDIRLQYEHAEVSRLDFLDLQYHNDEAVSWLEKERAK